MSGGRDRALMRVPAPLPPDEARAERQYALDRLHGEMRACQRCVDAGYLTRAGGIAGFRGHISDRYMLIGQAPGRLSVAEGRPFAGPSGRMLDLWLQRAGFAPDALHREVYLSAMTKCDPGKHPTGNGDRKPSPAEVALCRPFLERELELVRPRVLMLVGGMAIEAFLGPARLDDVVGASYERCGVQLLPLPHPSGVSRWLNDAGHQAMVARALERLAVWRRDIEAEAKGERVS
ncbi:MAG TPA: uracil-DNA glycosylase family protein [Ktedonobacterales bacterium]|nr:uracil-DNA glycosylase family protein [Ktedonobacterales bacterium]